MGGRISYVRLIGLRGNSLNPIALKKFAEAVRKATKTGIWSNAVKLARDEAVQIESQDDDEIVARVRSPGRAVAPTAVLYPGEREWDCDCGGRVMPCEHIAAVAIVLAQDPRDVDSSGAPGEGPAIAAPRAPARAWGRIIYRLARAEGGLRASRAIVTDDKETPLSSTLSAVLSRPAEAASVSPEEVDLRADQLLGAGSRAALPPPKLDALLRLLAGCGRVLLDGRPVAVTDDELLPRARVEDVGEDVRLTIEASPTIREIVSV
ncbi:MAG TPA: helicase, partial [Polyangia bacterium]|nr:helicase [Polyangia bacterium]